MKIQKSAKIQNRQQLDSKVLINIDGVFLVFIEVLSNLQYFNGSDSFKLV